MEQRPSLFIGSSSESLSLARNIQAELEREIECTIWNQGVFGLGGSFLTALVDAAKNTDFALMIVNADDMLSSRGVDFVAPRDNVLFELGLFMGVIGVERTYFLYNRESPPKIPTDLSGIVALTYGTRQDGNVRASLSPACNELRSVVLRLGVRPDKIVGKLGATQLLHRAKAEAKRGNPVESLALVEQALSLDESDPSMFISKITALRRLGRYKEAIESADHALGIFHNHPGLLYTKAYTYWSSRNYEEAIKGFDSVLDSQLDDEETSASSEREQKAIFFKGRSLELSGEDDAARKCYEMLIDLAPDTKYGRRAKDHLIVAKKAITRP